MRCLVRRTDAGEARARLVADHEALRLSDGERKADFHGANIGTLPEIFKCIELGPGK